MPAKTDTLSARNAGTIKLGNDMTVNRFGYGAMRLTGDGIWGQPRDRQACINVCRRAIELDVNFIDTADSYGPAVSEEILAEALRPYPKDLVIATKGGWVRAGYNIWGHNASPQHLREALEGSLRRLHLERIDLYQLHVPDPVVSFDVSVETLAELQRRGKIRHVGLSNVDLQQLERARKIVPIVSVQNRFGFADREWGELAAHCEKHDIAFIPWAPIRIIPKSREVLDRIAKARGVSHIVIALAWILRAGPNMLPIPGTSSVQHLEENHTAASFQLSDDEFRDLSEVDAKPIRWR